MSKYNVEELLIVDDLLKQFKNKEALKVLKQYIEKYPNDLVSILYYIDILIRLDNYKLAMDVMDDYNLPNGLSEDSIQKYYILKVKLNIGLKNYDEAFDYYMKGRKNKEKFSGGYNAFFSSNTIYIFLKSRANKLNYKEMEISTSYLARQIIDYDEEVFKERFFNYNNLENDSFNVDQAKFNEDINLEELYNEIVMLLPVAPKYYNGPIFVNRCFKLDNCGYDMNGNKYDHIIVTSFYDTDQIISIVPNIYREELEYLQLGNYKKQKVKENRIDRFNAKYNIRGNSR